MIRNQHCHCHCQLIFTWTWVLESGPGPGSTWVRVRVRQSESGRSCFEFESNFRLSLKLAQVCERDRNILVAFPSDFIEDRMWSMESAFSGNAPSHDDSSTVRPSQIEHGDGDDFEEVDNLLIAPPLQGL